MCHPPVNSALGISVSLMQRSSPAPSAKLTADTGPAFARSKNGSALRGIVAQK
jgi:hypothetical protein